MVTTFDTLLIMVLKFKDDLNLNTYQIGSH